MKIVVKSLSLVTVEKWLAEEQCKNQFLKLQSNRNDPLTCGDKKVKIRQKSDVIGHRPEKILYREGGPQKKSCIGRNRPPKKNLV